MLQNSGVKISDVKYINVKGTSKTKEAISLTCSPSNPCKGIRLENIKLSFGSKPAVSSCSHAHGISRGKVIPRSCF